MRLYSASFFSLVTCMVFSTAQADDHASHHTQLVSRHAIATETRSARAAGLRTASSFSLEPITTTEPLIRQTSLAVKAPTSTTVNGFTEAPLPNDDFNTPQDHGEDHTKLRPDFFQRDHHQVGDALSGGAGANDQRRGHSSMAAGLAVAIPMD